MEKLGDVLEFVKYAHASQKRKFTNIPYTKHLEETANLLWKSTNGDLPEYVYIASMLHDICEDTEISIEEIERLYGKDVSSLVMELTSDKKLQNKIGKEQYLINKINNMSEHAFTIKLCDRFSNVNGLSDKRIPDSFVKKYIKETQGILRNIKRTINEQQLYIIRRIKASIVFLKLTRNL